MSDKEVTFSGRPNQDEIRQASALHFRLPTAIKAALVAMLAIVTIGLVGGFALLLLSPELQPLVLRKGFVAPFLIMAGVLIWRPLWQHIVLAKRVPAEEDVLMMSGTAGAEGLYFETDRAKVRLSWGVFTHHHSLPDLELLYTQPPVVLHILPRRFFASDADWQAFRQLVESNVPGAAAAGKAYPLRGAVIVAAIAFAVVFVLSFVL